MANKLFENLNFTRVVNPDVKITDKKIVFTKFEGCSLTRRRSINFSNFPYTRL